MKIVHLGVGWFADSAGGLNRYAYEIARGQARLDHDVTLLVQDAPADKHSEPRLTVETCSSNQFFLARLVSYGLAARKAVRGADVVVAHFAYLAFLPLALGWLRGPRFIVQFQGPWADEAAAAGAVRGRRLRRSIEAFVYRRAETSIVLSSSFAEVLEGYGVSRSRIKILWPGVDKQLFTPERRGAARISLRLTRGQKLVVCARRLTPRMGIDILLRAWALADHGETLLVIAGDGPARPSLEALADELHLFPGVRFVGRISDEELADLFAAADLSVVPTTSLEGFGLIVLESIASGTPVIGTDVGGLGEVLRATDQQLVPPNNIGDLADAMTAALTLCDASPDLAKVPTWADQAAAAVDAYL